MANENYINTTAQSPSPNVSRDRQEKNRERKESRQLLVGDGADFRGRFLNIQPGDQLIFENKGTEKDSSDLITLTNITNGFVAFKVKTTAPEKFRVKPSFGCIESGGTRTVEITIQPGFLMTAQRDKFLVMSSSLDQIPKSQNDLIEFWHEILQNETDVEVEEHRLRCQIVTSAENHSGEQRGGDAPLGGTSLGGGMSGQIPSAVLDRLEAINAKVDRLMALQHESSNSSVFATQWNIFTVGMAVVILFVGVHLLKLILGV